MALSLLGLVAALVVLVLSADRFVVAAEALARRLGWPPLWIGVLIVGFGTSLPELTVSALAARGGEGGLAIGNVLGSNVANIGLILGLTAVIAPIAVLRREFALWCGLLLAGTALGIGLLLDGQLGRGEALGLLAFFAVQLGVGMRFGEETEGADEAPPSAGGARSALVALGALACLVAGSKLFVGCAVDLARGLGVSELAIGLTVVAVGTSLPELASSIAAARRRQVELVVGNVIGSNAFNLLAVLGVSGLVMPGGVPLSGFAMRDLGALAAATLALALFGWLGRSPGPGRGQISRLEGALLLLGYLAFIAWLVASSPPA